jgi:hypothetical protein
VALNDLQWWRSFPLSTNGTNLPKVGGIMGVSEANFFFLSCISVVVRQSINKINSVKDSVGVVREPLDHCDLYALVEALCEAP